MGKKFHLVNGEPKPCTASVRDCPIGGEHYATEAEARSSYESSNEKNILRSVNKKAKKARKPMDPMKKLNIQFGAGALAVAAIGGGALTYAAHAADVNHQNIANKAAQTAYSITVQKHTDWSNYYTAKITDSNLKQTNFGKCVQTPKHDGEHGSRMPILCKTSDGKYSVRIEHTGKYDKMTKATLTIKDGKNNGQINNYKVAKNNGNSILIPRNITK